MQSSHLNCGLPLFLQPCCFTASALFGNHLYQVSCSHLTSYSILPVKLNSIPVPQYYLWPDTFLKLYFVSVDRIVLRIMNDGETLVQNDVFFVATSPFLGNKHSSYGQSLSFVIRLTEPALGINITTESDMGDVIDRETGDVILMGSYTSFTLVTNISVLADGKKYNYSVSLKPCHVDVRVCMRACRRLGGWVGNYFNLLLL